MRLISPASDDKYIAPAVAAMSAEKYGGSYGGFAWELALSRFHGRDAFQSCCAQLHRVASSHLNREAVQGDFTHNGKLFNGKSIMLASAGDSLIAGKEAHPGVIYVLGQLQLLAWPVKGAPAQDLEFEFIGFGVGGQDPFEQAPARVMKNQPFWLRRNQLRDVQEYLRNYL